MKDWFRQLPEKFLEFWKKYTAKQKALFFAVFGAVVVTLIVLVMVLNRSTYVTLSSFDSTAACATAANLLEENSIDIKVSNDALTISVNEDQISEARLLLGENGISTSVNDTDYDWLFDNSFNTTDSEKKLKAKINLQSRMETDISNISGVTKASVTINLPESTSSIYTTDENATVSIMLTISSDYDSESTQGIAEYARGCVGNEDTDDITIIDNHGTLLFSGASSSTSVSNNLLVEQQVEEYYNSKLWNLMVNSGVYDEVSVSSNLDVNISESQVKNVEYYSNDDDDTGPKESYYYYLAKNTDGTGGVVGTDANGEEITDYNLLDTSNGESTLNLIKETYNTSYTETVSVEPVGQVDMANSSMGMFLTKYEIYNEEDLEEAGELDGTTFAEYQASHSDITENTNPEDLVAMLAKATGIKESNIYVVERTVPIFYPAEEKSVPVQSIISILLAILIIALLIFVVFKGMKPEEQVEVEPELSVEALLATTKENQTLDDIEFSDKSATRVQIEKFVDENPEAVATLLRNWLNEDWE
jgi:flagellar M-ring protein FliF